MSRRRKTTKSELPLFPFLSIVICVIGILTLLIVGNSLTDMQSEPDPQAVARTKEYRELMALLAAGEKRAKELSDRESSSGFGAARLEAARKQLEELEARNRERERIEKEKSTAADEFQRTLDELKARLASLEKEILARTSVERELDREIEERGKPPQAVVSIRSTGTGQDMDPVFVECTDAGIIILGDAEPVRVRAQDLSTDASFLAILDGVADSAKGIVIFLLRDNGSPTYWAARAVADARGAKNGKIPVIGHGRIDLSKVRKGGN